MKKIKAYGVWLYNFLTLYLIILILLKHFLLGLLADWWVASSTNYGKWSLFLLLIRLASLISPFESSLEDYGLTILLECDLSGESKWYIAELDN